ncbi:diphosphomevalonate decarboxylase [Nocardia sp. JMUB6875]|uniref:diphosphomevalonate decarboxylase n=1 Tax=Nocardia sp. JMUB6875 TaxID=3158170 RepID=UPI0032E7150D
MSTETVAAQCLPGTGSRPRESAVAVAHPNIALVKYWGKRDEEFVLPVADSLSMTLDLYPTTTRVTVTPNARTDVVILSGRAATGQVLHRVERFLDLVRTLAGRDERAEVVTVNTVPTAAGLASSAGGFAALAVAAAEAYGLELDRRDLSRLARRGSGSACRSIFGGFAQWHAGVGSGVAGDLGSYAEPIEADGLDPAIVVAVLDRSTKLLSSRDAMRHTITTSPLYLPWANTCAPDLAEMRAAIARGDLAVVGEIAERNAFGMHATMLAARPSIRYLSSRSIAVLDRIVVLRNDGVAAYATIDAGPNIKVLCERTDAATVATALAEVGSFVDTQIALPGPGAALTTGSVL